MGITYKQLKATEQILEEKGFWLHYPDNPMNGEDYWWIKIFDSGFLALKVFNRQREWREFEDLRRREDFFTIAYEVYAGGCVRCSFPCRDRLDIERIEAEAIAFLNFAKTNLSSL